MFCRGILFKLLLHQQAYKRLSFILLFFIVLIFLFRSFKEKKRTILNERVRLYDRLKFHLVSSFLVIEGFFSVKGLEAVEIGYATLKELGIPYIRPEDYFAEMVKTDEHMDRV